MLMPAEFTVNPETSQGSTVFPHLLPYLSGVLYNRIRLDLVLRNVHIRAGKLLFSRISYVEGI